MKQINAKMKLDIILMFAKGNSYDEIALKTGVAKGSISNVVDELKNGQFPDFIEIADQLAALRSLAIELKKKEAGVAEALIGAALLERLIGIGVTPQETSNWVGIWKTMSAPGASLPEFTNSAIEFFKLAQATGEPYSTLVAKYSELQTECGNVQREIETLKSEKRELETTIDSLGKVTPRLAKEKKSLESETTEISANYQMLQKSVSVLEKRHKSLSSDVDRLNEVAGTLRPEVDSLKTLGFDKEDLQAIKSTIMNLSSSHDLKPKELMKQFFDELDISSGILGLKEKKDKLEHKVSKLEEEAESLAKITSRLGIPIDLVEKAIQGLSSLNRRGVGLQDFVSFHLILSKTGMDIGELERQALELGGLIKQIESSKQALIQMDQERNILSLVVDNLSTEAAAIKASLKELSESGQSAMKKAREQALADVKQAAEGMAEDITKWGDARAELRVYLDDLKTARYFTKLPMSKEALDSFVHEISPLVCIQYLEIAVLWCMKNYNPKLRPPNWLTQKYLRVTAYTDVELNDILRWSIEGVLGGMKPR